MDCNDIRKINRLSLRVLTADCNCGCFSVDEEIKIETILQEDICPYLIYLGVPYYETFHDGGFFPWMRNRDEVIVQCPYHGGAVEMAVKRRRIGKEVEVYGEIINVKSKCAWGCEIGKKVEFDGSSEDQRHLRAYRLLFPHLYSFSLIDSNRLTIQVQCCDNGRTIFEIS